jgi:hypothetical protein
MALTVLPHPEREQSEQSKDAGNSIQLSRPVAVNVNDI